MRDDFTCPVEAIRAHYGDEPTITDWVLVEQKTINKFAESTGDFNWIHIDRERAERESPFGTTIAHGFWTLSMSAYFAQQVQDEYFPKGTLYGVNYGLNRVRFMSPVRVGKRIRCVIRLLDVADRRKGRYLVTLEYKVEVEGEKKPAMVAEWLTVFTFPENKS